VKGHSSYNLSQRLRYCVKTTKRIVDILVLLGSRTISELNRVPKNSGVVTPDGQLNHGWSVEIERFN